MTPGFQVVVLDAAGQGHAVLAVGELQVLDIGPHDGRRPLVGHVDQVLAVAFVEGVLVVKLLLGTLAHDERLDAPGRRDGRRIDVDRDEEVAPGLVGDVGTRLQVRSQVLPQLLVRLAGVDHLHARHPLLDEFAQFQGHLQRQVLFIDSPVMRPGKFASVSCVDHHDFEAVRNILCGGNVGKNDCGCEEE